jgi:hypothetical protein
VCSSLIEWLSIVLSAGQWHALVRYVMSYDKVCLLWIVVDPAALQRCSATIIIIIIMLPNQAIASTLLSNIESRGGSGGELLRV